MRGESAWRPAVAACLLIITGCVSAPISLDRQELARAREAIEEARAAKAEQCAPELMASAQSRLLWAAHELEDELSEGRHLKQSAELAAQSEDYARQAREAAIKNCAGLTTIILMPDEDGAVGALSVRAEGAEQSISQAFHYTRVGGGSERPEPARKMDESQFRQRFAALLAAQPPRPARYVLYFISGTSELTEESKALIPQVLEAAKERQPAEVSIIGHSDATGSQAVNMRISAARAKAVEALLRGSKAPPGSIYLRFHGENDPLVPTPDNVPEPKNRRVEIVIL